MENEQPAFFKLSVQRESGETYEFEANRDNTELYRHMGALGLSMYDHVYIDLTDDESAKCHRIWRHSENYPQVEKYVEHMGFPLHDNLRKVNSHDVTAFDEHIARQSSDLDSMPEDWA